MSKSSRVAVIACAIALVAIFARGDEWAPTRAFRTFSKSSWIATNDGAARIVDKRIEPVSGTLPSRPGALLAASDGRIWVATQNCTIHWTLGGNDGWHQVAFAPWPRGAFRALAEDRRGRI